MIPATQICLGVGSGNIGDEMIARAFWNALPCDVQLRISVLPESSRHREPYPVAHEYLQVDPGGKDLESPESPGLLVGGTPVCESEGLGFPLRFIGARLQQFHQRGLSVDCVGVGVDRLTSIEAKALFNDTYAPIRSWTVRSESCRQALISLGVPESRVRVGADWAWLYSPRRDLTGWAADFWTKLGVDPFRPLLIANVVNMIWRDPQTKIHIADAIDQVATRYGLQIAFFCNECRAGDFFDLAAAQEVATRLRTVAHIVPNEYFSPDEVLALFSFSTVTVGQRYHFMVEAVMAQSVPVAILRGQKMIGLAEELGLPVGGQIEFVNPDTLVSAIEDAIEHRDRYLSHFAVVRGTLQTRAQKNLSFLRESTPFDACRWIP